MELRQLHYFATLAEELHFGRAAARLQLAQPALSQQIRNLEVELGVTLFQRTKRRVELTDAGAQVLADARALLAQASQLRETAARAGRGELGRLVLGCTGNTLSTVLPLLLRSFRSCYPGVDVVLHEACTEDQLDLLVRQQIQVGLLHPPLRHSEVSHAPIFSEPLLLALPHDHLLAAGALIEPQLLQQEPLILFPRNQGPALYDKVIRRCQEAGFSPNVVHEATTPQTVLGLVAAGVGCAFVAASLQQNGWPDVTFRPLAWPPIMLETAVAWRSSASPAVHMFCELAQAVARQESWVKQA
ncbi:MAG: LysR family transcriptional regulator [Chloroflexaceae bacterium]|jgi:DNA-binding transcriptional LysR family regulator|nr:LysR family transcriptional regulator [Chloroflexaceae bacterium]